MSRKPARLLVALLLVVTTGVFVAAAPDDHEGQDGEMTLDTAMDGMKMALREIGRNIGTRETHPKALGAIRDMQAWTLEAKKLMPHIAEEQPEGEARDKIVRAFQVDMAEVAQVLLQMEIDLLEGRPEKTAAAIQGQLLKLRDAGHETYQ